jgi:hypothetical protein
LTQGKLATCTPRRLAQTPYNLRLPCSEPSS